MKIVVIGGGIIGLSSAYYLHKAGHQVTIIEKASPQDGCSFGNAGMIVPSHFIPLAAPGMMSKGIRWMFNSESPFYVKPRLNLDLLTWGWQFYKHANDQHVQRSSTALKEIHLLSKKLYGEWARELPFDFGYHERGLLMLYQTAAAEHEEKETARFANQIGMEAHLLAPQEVQKLEPDVRVNARGAVYFPGDAHVTPQLLVTQLKTFLSGQGVSFINEAVTRLETSDGRVKKVITGTQAFEAEEVILAAGIWSSEISKQLNLSLPMQAGKGYSFTLPDIKNNTRIPSIFLEARVAVTPMGNSLRFGGTMEIAGIDANINMNRVKGIVDSISKYYPEMNVELPKKENVWYGLRPCPPDGLPFIGRSKKIKNLVIATGHSMMGLSLGPATGKLVGEFIDHQQTSVPCHAFNPERFE
jgi:D-amino-acid dehydrogenase